MVRMKTFLVTLSVLLLIGLTTYSYAGPNPPSCNPDKFTSKLKALQGGYEFFYWSGFQSSDPKCYTYTVQNTPGGPQTPAKWFGSVKSNVLLDSTLLKCPPSRINCDPVSSVITAREGKLLRSTLAWGRNADEYSTRPDAYQDEIRMAKRFPVQFAGFQGTVADERGKPFKFSLWLSSEVKLLKNERFKLIYTFRASGSFKTLNLFEAEAKGDPSPVLSWARKESPILGKIFSGRQLSRLSEKKPWNQPWFPGLPTKRLLPSGEIIKLVA